MKKLQMSWLAVLLLALAVSACGGGNAGNTGNSPETEDGTNAAAGTPAPAPAAEQPNDAEAAEGETEGQDSGVPDGFPLTVTDASGTEITLERPPERIVSIMPSETEVLFAVGAGAKVVGVDDWSDYPEEAAALPKVGGFETNIEAVLELEPDLVVGGWTMSMAAIEELRGHGLTVYASDPRTLDEVIGHIRTIGELTGFADGAEEAAAKLEEDRKLVAEAVGGIPDAEKKTVYVEFSEGWTVGKGEFMDELIAAAGGVNIADGEGWYEINEEAIIEANPSVILYSANVPGLGDTIRGRAGWDKVDAIANDRVVPIDDGLYVRPGPRLGEGLMEAAKAIYPELFPQ